MPGKMFANYRRDDERTIAARIRDRLATTFGDTKVFMDVDNLMGWPAVRQGTGEDPRRD
jgi:hypothetical protein